MDENKRVRELRKLKKMTQEEFGLKLGVTKVAISNIESGNRSVTDQMRRSICREFNVREEWLRTGEGPMYIERSRDEILETELREFLAEAKYDSFRERLIHILLSLPSDEWEKLENYARQLMAEAEDTKAEADQMDMESKADAQRIAEQIIRDKKAEADLSVSSGESGKSATA